MSVQNGERLATKQDLADMYQEILPYLGGSADAGFTPVGSIIAIMGVTAPANYLACDGTVYNISDYPELAAYFGQQFSMVNKFGGNGTTTFAVPNLQGEFLRGTGTNSHSGNGNGATVGTHQDSTQLPQVFVQSTKNTQVGGTSDAATAATVKNNDGTKTASIRYNEYTATNTQVNSSGTLLGVRPTNTSVLFCIATKNIYLDPKNDYSTEEKVIGTWIDGKTLYQRTIDFGYLANTAIKDVDSGIAVDVVDKVVSVTGALFNSSVFSYRPLPYTYKNNETILVASVWIQKLSNETNYIVRVNSSWDATAEYAYITIQYTKTTD